MKVVYYTDQVYMHGGLERVLMNKLNYLSKHTSIELHLITFQQENNPSCYPIPETVICHDLAIDYNRDISFLSPSNIKFAYKHYSRLKRVLKKIKPDVVVVCNYEFGFYFMPLLSKNSILIKEYHSSKHFNYQKRLQTKSFIKNSIYKLTDYFEAKYDYLVVLTNDELKYFNSTNTKVIPNAITTGNHKVSSLEYKRAITAGRVAAVKGFDYAIKAWKIVAEKYPDWKLDIYGDGEPNYILELQKQITDSNLENQVFLKGAVNNLDEEMSQSSIYVMSSLTECFPMVLLEAMSYGLPVVSFDCPNGPRNIVTENKDGLLAAYLNTDDLANKVIKLIENKELREQFGSEGTTNVQQYSEEKVMSEWLTIFNYD